MDYHLFYSIEEITFKNEDEVKQDIYDLWQECFGDSDSYTDFYFDWKIENNQVLLIYRLGLETRQKKGHSRLIPIKSREAELVAMLHLNPYTLMVKGQQEQANYIVGVATKESHRRKGLMARLLKACMEQMYKEEMPFTYLMPAKESIYLPFDFQIVYEQDLWNEKMDQLKASSDKPDNNFKIRVIEEDDASGLDELVSFTNEVLVAKYDVYVKRTVYYYKRLINEMRSSGGEVLLCYEQDQLIGYLAYMAERVIFTAEYIACENAKERVLKEFYKYLTSSHDMDIYKKKKGSQQTAIMVRIINLKACLSRLTSKTPLSLVLEVTDPIIKNNQGRFLIDIDENGASMEETNQPADLSITISDLTKLLFGKLENDKLDKLLLENYEAGQVRAAEIDKASDKDELSKMNILLDMNISLDMNMSLDINKAIQSTKAKLSKINTIESVFINDIV